jgi:transcriptional regulator with XRE-family HTH domain
VTARRGSPTARRRRLGAELRRLRDVSGHTIEFVAERLECSASKISRIETGQIGASPRDVRDILTIYGVPQQEVESLVQVAREARQKGWWQSYGVVLTGAYVGFESAADKIETYEVLCVPGLLQTADYARHLLRVGSPDMTDEEIESRIRIRIQRQSLLTQDDPVDLWVVLDEAVLARLVGGAEVMRRQLDHLATAAEWPNVTIQVLPFRAGAHTGMEGAFCILRFDEEVDPDMTYVAMATGGVFQEKDEEMTRYSFIFDRLRQTALSPEESVKLIIDRARELS